MPVYEDGLLAGSGGGAASYVSSFFSARVNSLDNHLRVGNQAAGSDITGTGVITDHVPGVAGTLEYVTWGRFTSNDPDPSFRIYVDGEEVEEVDMSTSTGRYDLSGLAQAITATSTIAVDYASGPTPQNMWVQVVTRVSP